MNNIDSEKEKFKTENNESESRKKVKIGMEINNIFYNYKLFETLESLSNSYSQRKTAKELNIAHSVLNRRIKNSEDKLGYKLVETIGRGSELTLKGKRLLNDYLNYKNRLEDLPEITIAGGHIMTGLLEAISYELPFKTLIYSSDNESAYKLAEKGIIDILALDDPLLAFENDLNFNAIAYDNLVLVSPPEKINNNEINKDESNNKNEAKKINNLNDLNDLKFISVKGSAERLAWNTLKQNNINFTITKEVKSQFDAFKIVKNSSDYYAFLNASYFKGNNVLKNETRHVISLIQCKEEKKEIKEYIDYLIRKCSDKIREQGFIPIKPWERN